MTLLLIRFTCRIRGDILIVMLPDAAFSQTSTGRRIVNSRPSSRFKRQHTGSSVPVRCWDQQPTDIVGFSPITVSCAPSSIMFLFNINTSPFMAVGWGGGTGGLPAGRSVGQTMVEESSLFLVQRVPEPLQKKRGGRRAATKMDGL